MIVGITGKAGVGKDTLFKLLAPTYPNAKRFAFADEIKVLCALYFDWKERHLNGYLKDKLVPTNGSKIGHSRLNARLHILAKAVGLCPELVIKDFLAAFKMFELRGQVMPREVMQHMGTEIGRVLHTDFWAIVLMAQIQKSVGTPHHFVTDVRFDSEAYAIKAQGGVIIQIHRPNVPDVREHSSESGVHLTLIDHIIINSEDVHFFRHQALSFLGKFNA
jgi:energy-coupling factor transporter ATP-binding protein EcfA2